MANPNFFFETLIPALYGQVLGSNQPIDFGGAPYIILPDIVYGNLSSSVVSKSSSYTLTESDGIILATTGNPGITITLPSAVTNSGKRYDIKKVDAGSGYVTIQPVSAQTIDDETVVYITDQYVCISIVSNGTNWFII